MSIKYVNNLRGSGVAPKTKVANRMDWGKVLNGTNVTNLDNF